MLGLYDLTEGFYSRGILL